MKKGLGRGLSSLLSIYENNEQDQNTPPADTKVQTTTQTEPEQQNKTVDSTDNILQNAKNLLDSLNNNNKTINIIDTDETVENNDYVEKRNSVQEKLNKANSQGYLSNESGTKFIPLSKIEPNPDQPRKNFDQESLKELAQSIQVHGVIQPIVVCPKGDDKFVIIAGERRYRACKMLKMETIPAIVKRYSEQEMKEIALIENLQRADLNPIETAYAMKQLVDNFGFTQETLARRLGVSRPNVTNTIRLLNLTPQVMSLVETGKIAPNSARALVVVTNPELQLELAKRAIEQQWTTREIEKKVKEVLNPVEHKERVVRQTIPELYDLRDRMQKTFSTKVNVIGNQSKGRIYIDYYSRDDLDRISALMSKLDKSF